MTDLAYLFLALTAVFALADWYAVTHDLQLLEYVSKPATMLALMGVAITLEPEVDDRRIAFVVALGLSMIGDVFLMLRHDPSPNGEFVEKGYFVPGLAAFLFAHLAYIVGFQIDGGSVWLVLALFVAIRVASLAVTVRLLASIKERGLQALTAPVRAYALVICGMVAAAAATGEPLAIAGALLFFFSDFLIAWSRFVTSIAWAPLAIIVTYHLGQTGLVLSLI